MATDRVVKHFNIVKDILSCMLSGFVDIAFDALTFEWFKEAFCDSTIMAVSSAAIVLGDTPAFAAQLINVEFKCGSQRCHVESLVWALVIVKAYSIITMQSGGSYFLFGYKFGTDTQAGYFPFARAVVRSDRGELNLFDLFQYKK